MKRSEIKTRLDPIIYRYMHENRQSRKTAVKAIAKVLHADTRRKLLTTSEWQKSLTPHSGGDQ